MVYDFSFLDRPVDLNSSSTCLWELSFLVGENSPDINIMMEQIEEIHNASPERYIKENKKTKKEINYDDLRDFDAIESTDLLYISYNTINGKRLSSERWSELTKSHPKISGKHNTYELIIGNKVYSSGLVCIDIDAKGIDQPGQEYLRFKSDLKLLDSTNLDRLQYWCERTKSGGYHLYFKSDERTQNLYAINRKVDDSLFIFDIFARNHCVRVCPTIIDNKPYEWMRGQSPNDIPKSSLDVIPEGLLEYLQITEYDLMSAKERYCFDNTKPTEIDDFEANVNFQQIKTMAGKISIYDHELSYTKWVEVISSIKLLAGQKETVKNWVITMGKKLRKNGTHQEAETISKWNDSNIIKHLEGSAWKCLRSIFIAEISPNEYTCFSMRSLKLHKDVQHLYDSITPSDPIDFGRVADKYRNTTIYNSFDVVKLAYLISKCYKYDLNSKDMIYLYHEAEDDWVLTPKLQLVDRLVLTMLECSYSKSKTIIKSVDIDGKFLIGLFKSVIFDIRKIVFEPNREVSTNELNLWRGFDINKHPDESTCPYERSYVIDKVNELIYSLLSTEEVANIEWFIARIKHIFKHPNIKIPNCIVLQSDVQGCGKSMLCTLLMKIIGERHSTVANGLDSLAGNYNSIISNKIFINVNEIAECAATKFHCAEMFKCIISDPEIIIREKYKSDLKIQNYSNIILCINNIFGLVVEASDRRYAIFKCVDVIPDKEKWFDEFVDIMRYKKCLRYVYNWLLEPSDFNGSLLQIPKSELRDEIKALSKDSADTFLTELVNLKLDNVNDSIYEIVNGSCQSSQLYKDYKTWCESNGMGAMGVIKFGTKASRFVYKTMRFTRVHKKAGWFYTITSV